MEYFIFIVNIIATILYLALAIRAVLPWLPHNKHHILLRPVYALTEPVLKVVRQALPPEKIGMDVSPFVVIILLWVVHQSFVQFLP